MLSVASTSTSTSRSGVAASAYSTATCVATVPTSPSTVVRGLAEASRAVRHVCSRTGRQMPAPTRAGPQFQPKL